MGSYLEPIGYVLLVFLEVLHGFCPTVLDYTVSV
jgi:hypothetical protein